MQLEEELPDAEESKREGAIRHKQRLGESIVGDRRETSPYEVSFGDSVEWRLLCNKELAPAELRKFKDAIHNDYFFEMFVEDLPLWGYIDDAADEDMVVVAIGDLDWSLLNYLGSDIAQEYFKIVIGRFSKVKG